MRRILVAGLATAGLLACGKASDRSVDLARTDSTYKLSDKPSASPAPRPDPPRPPPPPPAPAPAKTLTLLSGTSIDATTQTAISSRNDKAGGTFSAGVSNDVKDSKGRVVIPAGSTLNLTITELQPANDKTKADGRITVLVSSVTVRGQTYPVSAGITSMAHTLKGRGVGNTEIEKAGAGAVIGAIAGKVIGGNAKGTIIGAVVGGAAGAVVAAETANRDVVVAAGTPIVVTLNGPLAIAVK